MTTGEETTVDDGIGEEWKREAAEALERARTTRAADHVAAAVRELSRGMLVENETATIRLHCSPADEPRLNRAASASIVLYALIEALGAYVAHAKDPVSYVLREVSQSLSRGIGKEVARQLAVKIARAGSRVALVNAREAAYERSQAAAAEGKRIDDEYGFESIQSAAHNAIEQAAFAAFDDVCEALKLFDQNSKDNKGERT